MDSIEKLRFFLKQIQHHDKAGNYGKRNEYILYALYAARLLGLPGWFEKIRIEPEWDEPAPESGYFCIWIELPTGRVSWPIPFEENTENEWFLDKDEERSRRIEKFLEEPGSE